MGIYRSISFVVFKEDVMPIIDALSKFGVARITSIEDKRKYRLTLKCNAAMFEDCMNTLLRLASQKVWIKIVKV